jgi:hypothetical protein
VLRVHEAVLQEGGQLVLPGCVNCSLHHVNCSLNHVNCSLNHVNCSLNHMGETVRCSGFMKQSFRRVVSLCCLVVSIVH